jgi:predicted nucleic acid-binding protein
VDRAVELIEDYLALPLTRHGHEALVLRIFELRDNFTPYDASYAALAEALGAELLTADRRLAHAAAAYLDVVVHGV